MSIYDYLPTEETNIAVGQEPVTRIIPAKKSLLDIIPGLRDFLSSRFNRQNENVIAAPTLTPTPIAPKYPEGTLNFSPHQADTTRQIWEPPQEDKEMMFNYFPKDATSSAIVAFNESMYNPEAKNQNDNGTWDRGYFQMNDVAIQDLLKYYPNTMRKIGVNSFDDWQNSKWKDKKINFEVAKLYKEKFEDRPGLPAWSHWLGWQDQGFKDVGKEGIDYSK